MFWDGFNRVSLQDLPEVLRKEFLSVNNNPQLLKNMFQKDVQRLKAFTGWSDEQIKSIPFPTLVINGNRDFGSIEHAVDMCRLLPQAVLAIFPGGHGDYLGALETLSDGQWKKFNATYLIEEFLDQD